jgi:hypothetical protein
VASKAHRIAASLAGGCALVLAIGLSGCAAPQDTGVSDPAGHVHFTVPSGWQRIGAAALTAELKTATSSSAGGWMVAYEAGPHPKATDFLSFGIAQPFVFAEYGTLNATASRELSDQALRDFFLPVTSTARQNAVNSGFPLTSFRQLRDQVLTLSQGAPGVRETFDYTYTRQVDTWDEDALTDAGHTIVFLLVVHCTTACYSKYQSEITHLMSSVNASRLAQPTGPFTSLIGR